MAKKRKIKLDYRENENLYKINAQDDHVKKYQPEFLNIVNKHGHGNDADIVGMVSQVIKDYRKTTETPTLKGWKEYHGQLDNIKGIEAGVEKNWAQFNKMKEAPFTRIEYIIVPIISNLIENIKNINYKINENRILIKHALLIIKINLDKYQQISHDKTLEINFQKLIYLEQYAVNTLEKYKIIGTFCLEGLSCLNNILTDGNLFNTQMEQKINN